MKRISFSNLIVGSMCMFFVLTLSGCQRVQDGYQVIDVDFNATNYKAGIIDSLFQYDHHIILEETDLSRITSISKAIITDDEILILDNWKRLLVFDRNGRFMKGMDKTGHGKGEYIKLSDFDIKGDSVFVLDQRGNKILIYGSDFQFLSSMEVRPAKDLAVMDGGIALNHDFGLADGKDSNNYSYSFHANGQYAYMLPFHSRLRGRSFTFSGADHCFYEYGDSLFCFFPYNDMVYYVASDGKLHDYLQIRINNTRDRSIKPNMPFKTVEEILQSDTPSNIFSFCRCQDLIIFSYFGKEDTRIETIYSTRQGLLYNGPVGLDSNGMPVSIASYINRSTERQYLLSMVNPEAMRFFYNKRKGNENYPILNNIGTNLGSNGNPALIFYKIRDERTQ